MEKRDRLENKHIYKRREIITPPLNQVSDYILQFSSSEEIFLIAWDKRLRVSLVWEEG